MPRQPNCLPALFLAGIGALVLAGCGGTGKPTASAPSKPPAGTAGTTPTTVRPVAPAPASGLPAGWATVRMATGATLPYPPGWRAIRGDPGTASAALLGGDDLIRAYLNATPAAPNERPSTWSRFRLQHNAEEGDRDVRLLASRGHVVLGHSLGTCVTDAYRTSRTRYRELACIVAPRAGGPRTVLVAATQPNVWASEYHNLIFALDHFTN